MHTVMMNSMLMNTASNAQGRCAVSACPEMNNSLILIMDAIVLASIIILLAVLFAVPSRLQHRNMTSPFPCLPSQS